MKDQLDFALTEIRQNSKSPEQHIQITENEISYHRTRVAKTYPNISLFTIATGKVYGDVMQDIIITSFSDVNKHNDDTKYDAESDHLRLEIKSLRAINGKENKESYIASRIFNIAEKPKVSMFSTSSFQQAKPSFCDWFLFHILYGDADRLFLIPSKIVSAKSGKNNKEKGKLLLSKQHGTSAIEGQINLSEVLKYHELFEIPEYNHTDRYQLSTFIKEIEHRLSQVHWVLPE